MTRFWPVRQTCWKKQAIALGVVVAVFGFFATAATFAVSPQVALLEADRFTPSSDPALNRAYDDSGATLGEAFTLRRDATISLQVYVPAFTKVVVAAKGRACQGPPTMNVKVDGTTVSSFDVTDTSFSTYRSGDVAFDKGLHTFSIEYPNDYYESRSCDRDLFIDYVALRGPSGPDNLVSTVEAESFPTAPGVTVEDSVSGSGGKMLQLTEGSVVSRTFTSPQASYLLVQARSAPSNCGWPRLRMTIDGAEVLNDPVVGLFWSNHPVVTSLSAGTHVVTLALANPLASIGCTRTLFVDMLRLYQGASTPPEEPVWVGDFETGDLSQWLSNQSCPDGVTVVESPVRGGRYSARFTTTDQSNHAFCPDVPVYNNSALINSPRLFHDGDDFYIGFSTYFPAGFPVPPDWFQVAEIYGPPYGGSPTIGIDVVGHRLQLSRDVTHGYDVIWTASTDFSRPGWEDIVLHVKFSTDPNVGFVELWRNGARQTFKDGSQTIHYNTLIPTVNGGGPNRLSLDQYRSAAAPMGTVSIYHDEARIGHSYQSVLP